MAKTDLITVHSHNPVPSIPGIQLAPLAVPTAWIQLCGDSERKTQLDLYDEETNKQEKD